MTLMVGHPAAVKHRELHGPSHQLPAVTVSNSTTVEAHPNTPPLRTRPDTRRRVLTALDWK
eukprot:18600-Eustigmatos_ZCMA.PRE.1